MKRPPTEWEKIFANSVSHKGLILKYTKMLYNSTSKNKPPNYKIVGRPEMTFFERRHTDGQQKHQKMSPSLLEKCNSKL